MSTEKTKTPWRKNLDKRYISGEDLLQGEAMNKGLKSEMVVTLAKYEDSPAFDQRSQKEVDKTAIWLKDFHTGKILYKPALLNVTNGEFLAKEIGNNSLYIDDFDTTKPIVMYAKPDKRHGHVVRFKKYYAPATVSDKNALTILDASTTLEELKTNWGKLTKEEKNIPTVLAKKEELKTKIG